MATSAKLRIKNNGGVFVVDSDNGFGLNYIGKATLHSSQANTSSSAGWKVYRITSTVPIVVFMGLASGIYTRIIRTTNIGSNTYEILVQALGGSTDANGFLTPQTAELFCYAKPANSPVSSGGIKAYLKDASNVVTYDFMRSGLLLVKDYLVFPTGGSGVALRQNITSNAKPAVLGDGTAFRIISSGGGPTYPTTYRPYFWLWSTGNTYIDRADIAAEKGTEDANVTQFFDAQARLLVINATGLA